MAIAERSWEDMEQRRVLDPEAYAREAPSFICEKGNKYDIVSRDSIDKQLQQYLFFKKKTKNRERWPNSKKSFVEQA